MRFLNFPYLPINLVKSNWRFPKTVHQRVLKLRGDVKQIFVNGEFSGSSSGFWDYTIYVNPYMVVRPEGHYTKHIYVNSERIASKIGNPEDYAGGDPTGSGSAVGRKIKMEEVVEENFNELFGNVPEIEQAAEQDLGMSTGNTESELNSYWFTSDHLGSSAFVTDGSGVAIQHLEIDRREIREPPLKQEQGREQYMAFGEVFVDQRRTGFGTPYKFNAKELDCSSATWSERTLARLNPDWSAAERRDESGYYYYSARYYDPRMARFLSVDPLAGDMPAWGSYTYTFNNPLTVIDPDGMSGKSIHKDANGNIIAEIEDGDNNVYVHNDIQAGQHIDGKISRLKLKRDANGNGGGGVVDGPASFWNKLAKLFEEGPQQQHSGENWFIYGKGAVNGWSITAPKPDPQGKNKSIDISDMLPDGGGSGPSINPILGLDGFNERVNSAVERLQGTGFDRKKVCTICGDTLDLNAPKSYHTGFDTIKTANP